MNTPKMNKPHDINTSDITPVGEGQPLRDKMADAAEGMRDTAAHMADEVKNRAAGVMETARDAAVSKAEEARIAAADAGDRLSDQLRDAAERQPEDSFSARALSLVAGGISDLSRKVDSTSVSQAMSDARELARRHPVATATVAAAVGFALMRLLRAAPGAAMDRGLHAMGSHKDTMGGMSDRPQA
jgi:ElaB/YqjD/DUF883 family membrane-anchored ribosome-binding protein